MEYQKTVFVLMTQICAYYLEKWARSC